MKYLLAVAAVFVLSLSAYSLAFQSSSANFTSNRTAVTGGGTRASASNSSFSALSQVFTGITNSSSFEGYHGIFADSGIIISFVSGNSSVVSVDGNASVDIVMLFQNSDGGVPSVSGKIWVEQAPGIYDAGIACTSNSTGHCKITFDPDCTYAGGPASIIGGIASDNIYADSNATAASLTIDSSTGCQQSVSFSMQLSVDSTNDVSVTGSPREGRGFYSRTHRSACVQGNATAGKPTIGIVFAGSSLESINATARGTGEFIEMKQSSSGNRFIIPVAKDGCSIVESRLDSLSIGQPFVSFGAAAETPLEFSIIYDNTDIAGDFSITGSRLVSMKKTSQEKILFEVPEA